MYSKSYKTKSVLRMAAMIILAMIMALSLFFAAACSDDDDDSETEKTTSSSDKQTILNGNFEYYSDSDDETHIIYTPDNWSDTTATKGDTNYVKNGVLDTSASGWNKISDDNLAETLDYNNSLDEDDDDYDDEYVDYNGMKSRDIPYADVYKSLNNDDYYTVFEDTSGTTTTYYIKDDDGNKITVEPTSNENEYTYIDDNSETQTVYDKALISNPETHNYIQEETSTDDYDYYYIADTDETHGDAEYTAGDKVKLWVDENGDYFYDEDKELPYESHILMVHNYVNNTNRYGTAQDYASSTTLTIEPNTAAELSVWVKTTNLTYGHNGTEIDEGRGAYIQVEQTVGGNSVDSVYIQDIRTDGVTENNGWVKYTIYVRGCDFAETTITLTLGLGKADKTKYGETCEGYAFFDDVQCTLYSSLSGTSYQTKFVDTNTTGNVYTCLLTDEEEDKIFSFDDCCTVTNGALDTKGSYYYADLTSQADDTKKYTVIDGTETGNTTVDYTRDSNNYITSEGTISSYNLAYTNKYTSGGSYKYSVLTNSINTSNDVLAVYTLSNDETTLTSNISNSSSYGSGYTRYASTISDALISASSLPNYNSGDTALVMLSAQGAAYTATITNNDVFTVEGNGYMILSFWIKTSDMTDYTGATVTLYSYKYDNEGNMLDKNGNITDNYSNAVIDTELTASLSIDTTGVTFDVGDDEDIYDGWVQAFFYIENPTNDNKTFQMQISFGNTTIKDTSSSDYKGGYVAVTGIQTMTVDEDVFNLASTGSYGASFTLENSDSRENLYFDTTSSVTLNSIKTEITNPSSYTGVNGGSASIIYSEDIDSSLDGNYYGYDAYNTNGYAGLINQDYLSSYSTADWLLAILSAYNTSYGQSLSSLTWENLFGDNSAIQPLLIANTVRTYLRGSTDMSVMNYGYIANSATSVSSDSYEAITVRVYVSKGAVAYVYLTQKDGTSNDIMSVDLPDYSFWYDDQGNVLDGEPDYDDDSYNVKDHIVYYIRDDGLYEDANGNLYANLYNYSRKYYDESVEYWTYDENGTTSQVILENTDSDVTYYASEADAVKAYNNDDSAVESPHYLVAYDSDGDYTRVFSYYDGAYHYIITNTDDDGDEYVTYSDAVNNFNTEVAPLRYNNTNSSTTTAMYFCIDARYNSSGELTTNSTISSAGYDANGNYVADSWQTVTFYIHTGDTDYDYTLELWSGSRDSTGVGTDTSIYPYATSTVGVYTESYAGSYVAFDTSSYTVDEDSYSEIVSEYTDTIIDAYVRLLNAAGQLTSGVIKDADQNLSYYKNLYDGLVSEGTINENSFTSSYTKYLKIIKNLDSAVYYTYSLYDDAGYVPFNSDTASDEETGYSYALDDYEETLVYLNYISGSYDSSSDTYYATNYVAVVDYSATDVTVDSNIASDEDEDEDEEDTEFSVWLLVASIILAVVLIFTMLSLLIRDIVKKLRRRRVKVKNVYTSKRKHYIRKLGLTEAEAEDGEAVDTDGTDEVPDDGNETE